MLDEDEPANIPHFSFSVNNSNEKTKTNIEFVSLNKYHRSSLRLFRQAETFGICFEK